MLNFRVFNLIIPVLLLALGLFVPMEKANAQESRQPSTCLAVAQNQMGLPILKASYTKANSHFPEVEINYVGHSNFRITSPEGVIIETDFAGTSGKGRLPDVVTMNHAHRSHFTENVPADIKTVLRGWSKVLGEPAEHYLTVGDVLIRNVATDVYRGGILIEPNGNSIFIFEVAGLCIGHVGHMHHKLSPELIAQIGRLDVVMIPVDGSVTMSLEGMAELASQLRSSIILPMHWFSTYSLNDFMAKMSAGFSLHGYPVKNLKVSLASLPKSPTVIQMTPQNPRGGGGGGFFDD